MIINPSIQGMLRDNANNNIYTLSGAGAPAALGGAGFAGPGSYYTNNINGDEYLQVGTLAVPVWIKIGGISALQSLSGQISPANIIGVGAGQFGHANGVILVPAAGALVVTELVSVMANFRFGVAAYTAGGNITVNQGAGGAALTGLVSAANSLGNAASKDVAFVPLSTAAIPLVRNGPINLVSSAAFTNPGTATGVVNWVINFRQYAVAG